MQADQMQALATYLMQAIYRILPCEAGSFCESGTREVAALPDEAMGRLQRQHALWCLFSGFMDSSFP